MIATTVQQPWAWAIIHGLKPIENRSNYRMWQHLGGQTIAIHAGLTFNDIGGRHPLILRHEEYADAPMVKGAVLGTVHIIAVHQALADCCRDWRMPGRDVHLVLTDPRPIEPIECRGRLGPWILPSHVAVEVLERGRPPLADVDGGRRGD